MSKSRSSICGIQRLTPAACLVVVLLAAIPTINASPRKPTIRVLVPEGPECYRDCRGAKRGSYCASNGRTYDSKCRADQAVCRDSVLTVRPGKCKNTTICLQERNHSDLLYSKGNIYVFRPTCNKNGSYDPIQCERRLGSCWCVTVMGHVRSHTKVQIGEVPLCGQSPPLKNRCRNEAEKIAFALKLTDLSVREYQKKSKTKYSQVDSVIWKHDRMDKDKNGRLSKREFSKLVRTYRKKLPRQCTKNFLAYCDNDNDGMISVGEWKICLIGPESPAKVTRGISQERNSTRFPITSISVRENERRNEARNSTRLGFSTTNNSDKENEPSAIAPTQEKTCSHLRNEIIKANRENIMIPECQKLNDRLWAAVQCHEQYCYCVVPATGRPISETAVRATSGKPDCDNLTSSPTVSIPIPGCPAKHKVKFLNMVNNLLAKEMLQELGGQSETTSSKEVAARWYFERLDENRDGVLMHKENKKFKKYLSRHRVTKRCLRKFTKHCDRNSNRKTTIEEFIACLEVRQERPPRLRGIGETISQLRETDDHEINP